MHQNSTRRPPREGRNNKNCGRSGRKTANFLRSSGGGSGGRAVLVRGCSGFLWVGERGPGNPSIGQTQKLAQNIKNTNSGQLGQKCWFGQSSFWPNLVLSKPGPSWFGQTWPWCAMPTLRLDWTIHDQQAPWSSRIVEGAQPCSRRRTSNSAEFPKLMLTISSGEFCGLNKGSSPRCLGMWVPELACQFRFTPHGTSFLHTMEKEGVRPSVTNYSLPPKRRDWFVV